MKVLTDEELHMKALQLSEDSQKINTSMYVVRVGFVKRLLKEQQDALLGSKSIDDIKWNINENMKPNMNDFNIHIEVKTENDFNVMIDGQRFDFTSWVEYVNFAKVLKIIKG
ncbi:MAG TPA: hypothetical protein VLZ29_06100 [Sulfurimonas sp.]|uniref:hypothetical protein n=1 Tax=Sulfurimonas sp. TaxID=2022749 RepID=UPI002C228075|nr:hypothetical protein [Sulfurimonas sp.]HUH42671.1 hypothetical protein [Sulfurimonas sp.]